jgi:hypothetical protein
MQLEMLVKIPELMLQCHISCIAKTAEQSLTR